MEVWLSGVHVEVVSVASESVGGATSRHTSVLPRVMENDSDPRDAGSWGSPAGGRGRPKGRSWCLQMN